MKRSCPPDTTISAVRWTNDASLTLWSFLPDGESAEYRMYRDDGVTTEYEKKEHWKTLQIHHS